MYGLDYTINPYYGCSHACVYCYVPSIMHVEAEKFRIPQPKTNIVGILRREIRKKRKGLVGISTATDAYQPMEKKYKLTRKILMVLKDYGFPVDIQTKSPLVLRDMDIIKGMDSSVGITITTFNDGLLKSWEPFTPSPEERIKAVERLVDNGISAYIFFGPVHPLMNENDIRYAMEEFMKSGVEEIIVDRLHLKRGVVNALMKSEEGRKILKNAGGFEKILRVIREYEGKMEIRMAWEP